MSSSSSQIEPYGGIFSYVPTKRVSGVKPGVGVNDVTWMSLHIVACAIYARQDLECECYLKVDDCKPMKSDCVSAKSPQAIVGDWRVRSYE